MGYTRHHAIIVTSFNEDYAKKARDKATDIFGYATDMHCTSTNQYYTFMIPPDGSKEGWTDSDEGDSRRAEFIDWLESANIHADWIEVQYGDDNGMTKIIRDSDEHMREEINLRNLQNNKGHEN